MNKIELIDLFLKKYGITWNNKQVYDENVTGLRKAKEEDFDKYKISVIPVSIPQLSMYEDIDLVLSVDLVSFISYGISFDTPSCFAVSDEFREILDENNLSKEWQSFCLKHKGLVYKKAVDNFVENSKLEASDNYHKETIKHIQAIKFQSEIKKGIFKMLDTIQEDINIQYENLNK